MNARTPFNPPESVVQEAFDIAMNYLQLTGHAEPLHEVQRQCAQVIVEEWRRGKQHPVWLANKAITAVEDKDDAANATVITIRQSQVRDDKPV
jgi:hypothetical protein